MKHGALACVFLCNPWETEGTLFTRCFSGNGPASSGTVFRASCRNSIACAFLEPGVRGRRYYFLFFRGGGGGFYDGLAAVLLITIFW